jgi:hypothetical protein
MLYKKKKPKPNAAMIKISPVIIHATTHVRYILISSFSLLSARR